MIRAAQSVATKRMMMEKLHNEIRGESPNKTSATDDRLTDLNLNAEFNDVIFPYNVIGFKDSILSL